MTAVLQPPNSSCCGQACLATALGISLEEACRLVGHSGGTRTRELVAVLRGCGFVTADKMRRVSRAKPTLPQRAIVCICKFIKIETNKYRSRRAHWMLTWDGVMYDPEGDWPNGYDGWTITSYLEIGC